MRFGLEKGKRRVAMMKRSWKIIAGMGIVFLLAGNMTACGTTTNTESAAEAGQSQKTEESTGTEEPTAAEAAAGTEEAAGIEEAAGTGETAEEVDPAYAAAWEAYTEAAKSQRETLKDSVFDDDATVSAISYDIDLKLDTEKDRMEQTVRMEIRNNSDKEDVSALYLRCYPNGALLEQMFFFDILTNPEAKALNEGKSAAITSVMFEGSEEELVLEYFQANSLVRVDLKDRPIKAGETAVLQLKAWADLPVCSLRYGKYVMEEGVLYNLAMSFPYLEYNRNGEWYLDPPLFYHHENRNPERADYHVTVDAPEEFLVAGPGEVTREGRLTTFDAKDCRDIALFASDIMGIDTFEVQGVTIENCYLKTAGEEEYRALSKQYITDAFNYLTELIGPYTRDRFTLVEGVASMEYSGIAEVEADNFFEKTPSNYPQVYDNTIHEIGHQWFFDAVGNNEYREGWIDEGFTQFLTWEILCRDSESWHMMKEYFNGTQTAEEYAVEREKREESLQGDLEQLEHFYLDTKENEKDLTTYMGRELIKSGNEGHSGMTEYGYAPHFLHELKSMMGEEEFWAFVRDVAETFRFKIADTEGVLSVLEKHDDSEEVKKLIGYYFSK